MNIRSQKIGHRDYGYCSTDATVTNTYSFVAVKLKKRHNIAHHEDGSSYLYMPPTYFGAVFNLMRARLQ
jgi:hypothetical protein